MTDEPTKPNAAFLPLLATVGAVWAFYGATLIKLMEEVLLSDKAVAPSIGLLVAVGGFLAVSLLALAGLQSALAASARQLVPEGGPDLWRFHWVLLVLHLVIDGAAIYALWERMRPAA